jgi:predicted ATP-grasp superfamily ATP-dependent carboligase
LGEILRNKDQEILRKKTYDAVVFGLFETGLGVIRSLGKNGLRMIGIDFKTRIGNYSRYAKSYKCPHPLHRENEFIKWLRSHFSKDHPIPVFITQDDFLEAFSRNQEALSEYFLVNMIDHPLVEAISDKYQQSQLALKAGVAVPNTWVVNGPSDLMQIQDMVSYPVIIKGRDVNAWRDAISRETKVYLAKDPNDLTTIVKRILGKGVSTIVQEVIQGPDTNHYKYCSYTTADGIILAEFTLQKIRQNPAHFGFGAVIESIYSNELIELGRKLFSGIGFTGVGSAEFKLDQEDNTYKLIEINPRYWQQNSLATECGINFPYINYLDLLNKEQDPVRDFKSGIKWINWFKDFDSYLTYRNEGSLSYRDWRKSLKGEKVYSDFTWDDPLPRLYQIGFGPNLFKIWRYILKKIRGTP